MICSVCGLPRYNLKTQYNKTICQTCVSGNSDNFNAISGMGARRPALNAYSTLPNLVTLSEWSEVIKLCRKASSRKLLTEDAPIKTIPLPNVKNPFYEKPTDNRSGWSSLESYYNSIKETKDEVKHLFEG